MALRTHSVTLYCGDTVLRPLTERDWALLLRWNNDPEVLYYSEGDDIQAYSLDDVQSVYRGVSQRALCFVIEQGGLPIGECWLQEMNLPRLLAAFPGHDLRRIDISIGEKEYWGKGIGSRAIAMLAAHAFERERADAVFGCDIGDYNERSLRAFRKVGFDLYETVKQKQGLKASYCNDVMLTRERYLLLRQQGPYPSCGAEARGRDTTTGGQPGEE
jgi:RimJ/RimL family protein N-acetyltransferase